MKTRMTARVALGASAALLGLTIAPVFMASAASAAPIGGSGAYNCAGGNVPPGTYRSMTITGVCYMPAGNIVVRGNLTVAPGALLDAVTPGDPPASPTVAATVVVGGNVFVGRGAVFLFGCSPNFSCPMAISHDRIGGNLIAVGAQGVVVHSSSIGGSASLLGGGGGAAAETCAAQPSGNSSPIADLEPWSEDPNLDTIPVYSDFEDNSIGGNLTVTGLTSCWVGSFREQIGGNLTVAGNTMGDPDAMEIANNLINGNMSCFDNTPGTPPPPTPASTGVQFGDSGAAPNIVAGFAIGECGFNVVLPNPAPEAMEGPGIPEHITVSARSLGTYYGTHTSTTVTSPLPVTTESGDTLIAEFNDFVFTGTGLTGSGTYNSSLPPGQSGEVVLSTVYPNGSSLFEAIDTCTSCSFAGRTGSVTVRAYGMSSANGSTYGTFLIVSGGAVAAKGGLSTLAGWGTFSSYGQPTGTLRLVEHLRIT